MADNTSDLFMLCVHVMVDEYVLYALELALNGVVCCGVVCCGVLWCSVVCCGLVWCAVV